MKTYMIADLHFGHQNIIKYCRPEFANVDEMDKTIIENWNNVVSPEDEVFVLGDLSLSADYDFVKSCIQQLNGKKSLILGNHDNFTIEQYYSMGFDFVSKYPIIYKGFYLLSHEPLFVTEMMPFMNIYGHVHDSAIYETRTSRGWCVCVERHNYYPVEFNPESY